MDSNLETIAKKNVSFTDQVQVIEAIVKTYMQQNKKAVDLYQSLHTECKTEINMREILEIKDKSLIDYIKENLKLEPLLEYVITAKDLVDLQKKLIKTKYTAVEETAYYKKNSRKYDEAKAEHKLLTDIISSDSHFNKTQKGFQNIIYERKRKQETAINEFEAKVKEYNTLQEQTIALLEKIEQLNRKYETVQKLNVDEIIIYAGITKETSETNYGFTILFPSDSSEMTNSYMYNQLLAEISKSTLELKRQTGNNVEIKESIIKFNLNYKREDISAAELEKERKEFTEKITAHFKETLLGKLGYELRVVSLNESSSKDYYLAEMTGKIITQEQGNIDDAVCDRNTTIIKNNVDDNKPKTLDMKALILDYLRQQSESVEAKKITEYVYKQIVEIKTGETIDKKVIKESVSGNISGYIYENTEKIIDEQKLAKSVSGRLSYLIKQEVIKRKGDKGNYKYYLPRI